MVLEINILRKGRGAYVYVIIYDFDVCDFWKTSDFRNQSFLGNYKDFVYSSDVTNCSYQFGNSRFYIHSNSDSCNYWFDFIIFKSITGSGNGEILNGY